jgi:hypothetical protein
MLPYSGKKKGLSPIVAQLLTRNSVSSKIPFIFASPATDKLKLGSPESRDRLCDLLLDHFSLLRRQPLPNFSHLFRRWDFEIVRYHEGRSLTSKPARFVENSPTDEDRQIGGGERADQINEQAQRAQPAGDKKAHDPGDEQVKIKLQNVRHDAAAYR